MAELADSLHLPTGDDDDVPGVWERLVGIHRLARDSGGPEELLLVNEEHPAQPPTCPYCFMHNGVVRNMSGCSVSLRTASAKFRDDSINEVARAICECRDGLRLSENRTPAIRTSGRPQGQRKDSH